MIKRIELVNFMSHERTVIEPAAGLTVLVGPNNCGKSAFVSALQFLCHNSTSNFALRHGEKHCSVTVETDEGDVIEWSNSKSGSPKYVINGELYDRLRRSVPEQLHQILGLATVDCGNNKEIDVHFGQQQSPVFLLDDGGSAAAQFFASSSDASRLVEMQALHKTNVSNAGRDQSRLVNEKQRMQQALAALEPVDRLQTDLAQCEADYQTLIGQQSAIEQMSRLIERVEVADREFARAESTSVCLSNLAAPPPLRSTVALAAAIDALVDLQRVREQAQLRLDCLDVIAAPPELAETMPLEHLLSRLVALNHEAERTMAVNGCLNNLAEIPKFQRTDELAELLAELIDAEQSVWRLFNQASLFAELAGPPQMLPHSELQTMVKELESAHARVAAYENTAQSFGQLKAPPELHPTEPLQVLLAAIETAAAKCLQTEQMLELALANLDEAERAIEVWVEANPFCPTCGGETDARQLIATEGHRHEN